MLTVAFAVPLTVDPQQRPNARCLRQIRTSDLSGLSITLEAMSLKPRPTNDPLAGSPTAMQVAPLSDPRPIDVASWARRSHFEHYLTQSPCTYALTAELDVTRLNGSWYLGGAAP